ncbi:R3H domain-containing protein 4-like [Ptychodera flava]|uniref:R3H domain-containing protein 4-like n=1 Tax=Ptychodera flava TaxID=63121 RepID=UPI00396A56A2
MGVQKVGSDYMNHAQMDNDVGLIERHAPGIHGDPIAIPPKSPKSRKQHVPKSPRPQSFMKEKGYKHARRYQNTCYLLEMVDYEEFGEVNINDFMASNQTVFGELLTNEESMEIWNDFINHPEEEQEVFLMSLEGKKEKLTKSNEEAKADRAEGEITDKRLEHPAFTPEQCFRRISGKLKALLHRRHLPKGTLETIEDDVLSWFTMSPDSVYVSVLPSSYDRLLLHAVCQYLDLHSMSADYEGTRHTEVVNNKKEFLPPDLKLSEFLERFS